MGKAAVLKARLRDLRENGTDIRAGEAAGPPPMPPPMEGLRSPKTEVPQLIVFSILRAQRNRGFTRCNPSKWNKDRVRKLRSNQLCFTYFEIKTIIPPLRSAQQVPDSVKLEPMGDVPGPPPRKRARPRDSVSSQTRS